MKRALIFGVGGQDGSYLAEFLLENGYEVHGTYRRSSLDNLQRIWHLLHRDDTVTRQTIHLYEADLTDMGSIYRAIKSCDPHEVYNDADQDNVDWSYHTPEYSLDVTAGGPARILEAIRTLNPQARFFQPCSATQFGSAPAPQNELTSFAPTSPYGIAKCAAYYWCQHYRREYGIYAATAVFYNHDSPRRSGAYMLHRICAAVAKGRSVSLGSSPETRVDIGFAGDYVQAAWKILQLAEPDDFVIGSGAAPTIAQWVRYAYEAAGRPVDTIFEDPLFHRPGRTPELFGDCTKALKKFGWLPKTNQRQLVEMILEKYRKQKE